jgi:peptide-methionine (S)-S-oxide reductase
VLRTRVGYAGGSKLNPTYRSMGDHTETTQVDFDPARISYREILRHVWNSHDPRRNHSSRQYMNAIFSAGQAQEAAALETMAEVGARLGREVRTVVAPLDRFYPAEDYHQKYYLRGHRPLLNDFAREGYGDEQLRESRVAARLNGYVGGFGTREQLERELPSFGLSDGNAALLRKIVEEGSGATCG